MLYYFIKALIEFSFGPYQALEQAAARWDQQPQKS